MPLLILFDQFTWNHKPNAVSMSSSLFQDRSCPGKVKSGSHSPSNPGAALAMSSHRALVHFLWSRVGIRLQFAQTQPPGQFSSNSASLEKLSVYRNSRRTSRSYYFLQNFTIEVFHHSRTSRGCQNTPPSQCFSWALWYSSSSSTA